MQLTGLPATIQDLAARLGLPAALSLVEKFGGTTIPVPMRATCVGESRFTSLADAIGEGVAKALCREYGGTNLYIPSCRTALVQARDVALNRDRDELARQGIAERDLVAELARRYQLSDRHVWRILKKVPLSEQTRPAVMVQARLC